MCLILICPGCQAKIRNQKHFKGAFGVSDDNYKMIISMDQVSLTDLSGTLGLGRMRYAMVICKISSDDCSFVPMRTLNADETERVVREFCKPLGDDITAFTVYCDAHQSLIKVREATCLIDILRLVGLRPIQLLSARQVLHLMAFEVILPLDVCPTVSGHLLVTASLSIIAFVQGSVNNLPTNICSANPIIVILFLAIWCS